jgi:hypothetical protein
MTSLFMVLILKFMGQEEVQKPCMALSNLLTFWYLTFSFWSGSYRKSAQLSALPFQICQEILWILKDQILHLCDELVSSLLGLKVDKCIIPEPISWYSLFQGKVFPRVENVSQNTFMSLCLCSLWAKTFLTQHFSQRKSHYHIISKEFHFARNI